jgi:hypothetical protein
MAFDLRRLSIVDVTAITVMLDFVDPRCAGRWPRHLEISKNRALVGRQYAVLDNIAGVPRRGLGRPLAQLER